MTAAGPPAWPWACPDCRAAVALATRPVGAEGGAVGVWAAAPPSGGPANCPGCGRELMAAGGSPGLADLRPTADVDRLDTFAAGYERVRRAEGRGGIADEDLRALPWPGPRTPQAWEWRIRSVSYELFLTAVLRPAIAASSAPLRALDLGAGQGWLSHRLAREGAQSLAVDLSADPATGLGAARAFAGGEVEAGAAAGSITLALADYRRLPLADGAADLAVFNASLHYSPDLPGSLAEARRALAPGGRIVVVDSPFYLDAAAGARMSEARHRALEREHGCRSDALGGPGFLRSAALIEAGAALGIAWRFRQPDYGLRFALRRAWRSRRLGRESATFLLAVGRADGQP